MRSSSTPSSRKACGNGSEVIRTSASSRAMPSPFACRKRSSVSSPTSPSAARARSCAACSMTRFFRLGAAISSWSGAQRVKRTACWPSTMLNVTRGAVYEAVLARRLPARCFEPAPRVDAGVVSIRRRPAPLVPEREWAAFRALVTEGFRGRAAAGGDSASSASAVHARRRDLGFVPTATARELDLHQWVGLHLSCPRDALGSTHPRTPLTRSREAGKESNDEPCAGAGVRASPARR